MIRKTIRYATAAFLGAALVFGGTACGHHDDEHDSHHHADVYCGDTNKTCAIDSAAHCMSHDATHCASHCASSDGCNTHSCAGQQDCPGTHDCATTCPENRACANGANGCSGARKHHKNHH